MTSIASYAYRMGEIAHLFCNSPSYNFDGAAVTRSRLRVIRDSRKIGRMVHVSFALLDDGMPLHPHRENIQITFKPHPVPAGYARRVVWHARACDVQAIGAAMPFRCPRCWSDNPPKWFFKSSSRQFISGLQDGVPHLCPECSQRDFLRGRNQTKDLMALTSSFIRKVTDNGRHIGGATQDSDVMGQV